MVTSVQYYWLSVPWSPSYNIYVARDEAPFLHFDMILSVSWEMQK